MSPQPCLCKGSARLLARCSHILSPRSFQTNTKMRPGVRARNLHSRDPEQGGASELKVGRQGKPKDKPKPLGSLEDTPRFVACHVTPFPWQSSLATVVSVAKGTITFVLEVRHARFDVIIVSAVVEAVMN